MGSAGLEWDGGDGFSAARGNQKTRFVGTGVQINALSTTYPGQEVFCTSNDSPLVANTSYTRNAANNAWIETKLLTNTITEAAEENTTPVTTDGNFTPAAARRYYSHFTMPTDHPFYLITGIEWKNGSAVGGNVTCGIDLIDADPPTINSTPLLAYGNSIAQSGTSQVQRNSQIMSNPIVGGTICGAWVAFSAGTTNGVARDSSNGSQKREKATAAADNETPTAVNDTAFAAAGVPEIYIKVYYKGYY